jgi:hypothetical protein
MEIGKPEKRREFDPNSYLFSMETIRTATPAIRYFPARFRSIQAKFDWLACNPTFRDAGRLILQRRHAREVICLLAEYSTVAGCRAARMESLTRETGSRNAYQRAKINGVWITGDRDVI